MISINLARFVTITIATLCLLLISVASSIAQDTRWVDVRFPRGSNGTTISDSLSGYQMVNYRVGVSAGQRMSVQLDTSNPSSYFNITAPGASQSLFIGSTSGNSTSFQIPSSGTYVVSVYLMRNAARRNESANYNITLYVENGAASTTRPRPPVVAPVPDHAGDWQGGPDYWQVQGLAGNDTLNVRSGPGTSYGVVGTVRNGDRLRNFGCTLNGSTRWCQVETSRGLSGWVAGRYLHESVGQATTLPAQPVQPIFVPPVQNANAVTRAQMPRYCIGEASARLGVNPQGLSAGLPFPDGANLVVLGSYRDGSRTTFFSCYFDQAGNYLRMTTAST